MNLSIEQLQGIFSKLGVIRLLAKPLAENDNSKQQIYLGGSFDVLNDIPFQEVIADSVAKVPNFKAKLKWNWITENGNFEPAPHAQLILYPSYPEVRLSGFLRGCSSSPSEQMRPIPFGRRGPKNSWDGRVLLMGIRGDGEIFAALSTADSIASSQFEELRTSKAIDKNGALYSLPIAYEAPTKSNDTKHELLLELIRIKGMGWIPSARIQKDGRIKPYQASNGGGYTLEAMLGIAPNGRSEPDFLGWELKAYSGSRITLMTPEPNVGLYGEKGVAEFLRSYGYLREDDTRYFTGIHKVGIRHEKTNQLLSLEGFDANSEKILNPDGGIYLSDNNGNLSAAWSYAGLISHWGRKHANVAYVAYEKQNNEFSEYKYLSPVLLGIGTSFTRFLTAMAKGDVVYDPAPKMTNASSDKPRTKARSQFRITTKKLYTLYQTFESEVI
jgi:hypothetical protein